MRTFKSISMAEFAKLNVNTARYGCVLLSFITFCLQFKEISVDDVLEGLDTPNDAIDKYMTVKSYEKLGELFGVSVSAEKFTGMPEGDFQGLAFAPGHCFFIDVFEGNITLVDSGYQHDVTITNGLCVNAEGENSVDKNKAPRRLVSVWKLTKL